MYKIGMIGDKDSILGFKAVGISVFPVTGAEEAEKVLNRLLKEEYAIIYVTEQIASTIQPAIEKSNEKRLPAIIPIPGNQGTRNIGMQNVKRYVERAVGADILFRDES